MIKKSSVIIIIFILLVTFTLPAQENYMQVKGDSLVGRTLNGEMIREVYGNVVITQGNVIITCNQATQFISRNEAELIGNVVLKQDSLTITTAKGFYYGDQKESISDTAIKLEDGKVTLTAKRGRYYFDVHQAFFQDSVKLRDSVSVLTSDSLTYYRDENRMVAVSNVTIVDTASSIMADSLEHFRKTRVTYAYHNIKAINRENHLIMFGDHLEDYPEQHYTIVNKNPILLQIDTTYVHKTDSLSVNNGESPDSTMQIDSLLIKSRLMEAYRDTLDYFKVTDSVSIVRGDFASINNLTLYFRKAGQIVTYRTSDSTAQPYLWYENTQLTGDSVTIFLDDNRIHFLKVNKDAYIISQNENYHNRFDQTSGDSVFMTFENSRLQETNIWGNMFSIYYQYDGTEPNGLTKSSAQNAIINFANNKVDEIRMYGSPNSEFYPERLVKGKEDTFVLAKFVAYRKKPDKESIIRAIPVRWRKSEGIN
jgi:lipopolysaccharide export system protein LptA